MARKIIIDTDPGVDDTMAIFYALASPELDVIGLTTIFGNAHTSLTTENALRLLEIAGREDIPVAKGADNPLTRPFRGGVPYIHGADGQGDVFLPPPKRQPLSQSAAEFIVEQIMAAPQEITLVPVGPLTNIALALRLEPKIVEHVQQVVIMGGAALVPGNVNPAAEANIYNDPEAADLVFSAGWDVVMVGLDVTHQIVMSREQIAHFASSSKPTAQHISRILPLYLDFVEGSRGGEAGMFVHDPSAISYLLAPDAFTVQEMPLAVATEGISRGKVWAWTAPREPEPPWSNRRPVKVCVDVDAERVLALELGKA